MTQNQLVNITTRGGVITAEFLENMKTETVRNPLIKPQTFVTFNKPAPENQSKLDEQIYISFKNLVERWDAISNFYENMDISDTRKKWIIPVLRELGFDPQFNREDVLVEGDERLKFKLSHRGWVSPKAPLIQTVVAKQELEAKHMDGGSRRSPHDEMQTFLNVSKDHKWGIVTNGILFRILRDFFHTTTKGYVEFDVENIMRSRNYHEFMAFYRIAHASRFLEDEGGISPLEQFYKESVAAGVKVGQNLQGNVKRAIEVLGNGFLTPEHIQQMIEDEEFSKSYYSEILRVIYRILFLLYAEQRAMLPTRDSLYIEEYGITHLREIAERLKGEDNYYDLWEGLKVTFEMLSKGCEPLKVFPYNGSLFDDANIPTIQELKIKNHDLLEAIRCLTLIEEERLLKRINYLDLGVEEIGSIYESLLDFTPRVLSSEIELDGTRIPANMFFLDPRGSARKTTGSYYTNPQLVDELIKSALKPVTERKLEESKDKEAGLLSLKVCDPACGSGAFLIAATNYLGKELAKVRTDQSEPPDEDMRLGRRDVLQHCIYGVDLNPMAVELAKVSLWIDSSVKDFPLNFLDHHIKCGNSLLGATPELIDKGIPNEAFNQVEGDMSEFVKKIKDKNKSEIKQRILEEYGREEKHTWAVEYGRLSEINETDVYSVKEKQDCYNAIIESPTRHHEKLIADTWCSIFFWSLAEDSPLPPTESTLRIMRNDTIDDCLDDRTKSKIIELSDEHRFFHWNLEFPDVFNRERKGFDCILGNPPWERIKLQEKEFFSGRVEAIEKATTAAKRKTLISKLQETNKILWNEYKIAIRESEHVSKFMRKSNKFPLTGRGDINTYPLFAELGSELINIGGRFGLVVKTGMVTDDTLKDFTGSLIDKKKLISLIDFSNKKGLFPGVEPNERFSLLTATSEGLGSEEFSISILNETVDEFVNSQRFFSLTPEDILKMNPNTCTLPLFYYPKDADVCKKIYENNSIIINLSSDSPINPWGVEYYRMFDMTNDSDKFREKEWLHENGFYLENGTFIKDDELYLPLYEAKLFDLFDYRYGTFEGIPREKRFGIKAEPNHPSDEIKEKPYFEIIPRYWVHSNEVIRNYESKNIQKDAIFVFRNTCRTYTDSRTARGTLIPFAAASNGCPLMIFRDEHDVPRPKRMILFTCLFSSFTFDFIVRQKMSGGNLNKFIVIQIAIPPPDKFEKIFRINGIEKKADEWIIESASKLLCNTNSMLPFFKKLGIHDIYPWKADQRIYDICLLDAIVTKIYGLSKLDYEYILDRFPILSRQETEIFGEFLSKKLCLEYYDVVQEVKS